MAIKFFLDVPVIGGYGGDPVDHFNFNIPYKVFVDDPLTAESGSLEVAAPLAKSGPEVIGLVYSMVLAECATHEWPIPTKEDIFGFLPLAFSQILPEMPELT